MSTSDKTKVIERVKSLLAMGNDLSSPNEAAIAMKRARHLMDEHQISVIDIDNISDDEFGEASYSANGKRMSKWISSLALNIAKLNDCTGRFIVEDGKGFYFFEGFEEDVNLTSFMLSFVVETGNRLYKRDKELHGLKGLGEKNDYLVGYAIKVCDRIKDLIKERKKVFENNPTGNQLVLNKASIIKDRFKSLGSKRHTVNVRSVKANDAGLKAGNEVHLNAFIPNSQSAPNSIA